MRVHIGVNKPEQLSHLLTMLDLSYIIQDMTDIKNTAKLQIIEDSKHEPDLKSAQEFVGGYVEGIHFS